MHSEMLPQRRPAFARDFPASPPLDALVDAFARGDYARVRVDAIEVERSSDDQAVKDAARTLVDRTRPDPLVIGLLGLAIALFVILTSWAIVHGRAPAHG